MQDRPGRSHSCAVARAFTIVSLVFYQLTRAESKTLLEADEPLAV
jgi:hypothetical protein